MAPTDVSKLVTPVLEPSKQLYMTTHPLAVPKIEENPLYTDKKQFLSSDYMATRLQADPERVYTRLRNGYENQEIAKEELRQSGYTLTKYTGYDQFLLTGIPNSMLHHGDLRKDGSIVLGKDVQIISQKVDNTGTIQAKDSLSIIGGNVRNLNGSINGNLVSIYTDTLENTSGRIHGKDRVHIEGKDIRNETQITTNTSFGHRQDTAHDTASITSDGGIHIQGDTIRSVGATIQGGSTVSLVGKEIQVSARALQNRYIGSGVTLDSTKYLGSTVQGHTIQVQGGQITLQGSRMIGHTVDLTGNSLTLTNVTNRTLSDVAVGARGSDYFNRKMVIDEQNLGATIEGGTGVKVRMDNNVSMKASTIHSKTGLVDVQAGRVSIAHGTERHETLSEIHQKDRGFLSSTTRDTYDHRRTDTVVGSTISSGIVKVDGKQDVLVKASHIVGDADVTVKSEGNLTITSAQEESGATHREEVRKSGIFGNGGLSVTIGKQRQTDTYDAKSSIAKGSVIGSRFGSVTLGATGSTQIEASDIASKEDIQVQGSGVTIRNGYTTSHTGETHRISKSGLTLSVSNHLVDTTTNAIGTLKRATTVKDERLQALLAYKTYDDAKTSLEKSKLKDQAKSLHLNLSLGTEKSEASTNVDSKIAKGSTVVSDGHIRVTTKKDDIHIEGSDVQGKDITLESANSIYVKGKETTSEMTQSMKQKQGSLGISYDVLQHRFSDISVNASGSKGSIAAGIDIVHDPSNIMARNTLGVNTKQDVHIKDGVLKGDAIEANVNGNLEIHSVQDTHDYTDHTSSGGMGLSLSKKGAFKSLQSSAQRIDIDSKYTSVIHQSGLYAGSTGFNISVGNTTTLEGALLASRTDTNILKTKQLVMKDMENRAKYTYGSKGVSYLADPTIGKSSKQYNELGLVPTIMPGEQGKANSITYSAIAKGVLDVEHPEVNLNAIRRNTEDSLHTLATIFDKQSIAERQETAKLFSKYMNEAIHRFGEMRDANGQRIYEDGSPEKVALHALSGAITSAIVKGNPTTGAISGGLNEALIQSISKLAKDHPARAQLLSASLGYTVNKLLGGHGLEGASIAQAGTKWNRYDKIEEIKTKLEKIWDSDGIIPELGVNIKKMRDNEVAVISIKDPLSGKYRGILLDNKLNSRDFDILEGQPSRFIYNSDISYMNASEGNVYRVNLLKNYKFGSKIDNPEYQETIVDGKKVKLGYQMQLGEHNGHILFSIGSYETFKPYPLWKQIVYGLDNFAQSFLMKRKISYGDNENESVKALYFKNLGYPVNYSDIDGFSVNGYALSRNYLSRDEEGQVLNKYYINNPNELSALIGGRMTGRIWTIGVKKADIFNQYIKEQAKSNIYDPIKVEVKTYTNIKKGTINELPDLPKEMFYKYEQHGWRGKLPNMGDIKAGKKWKNEPIDHGTWVRLPEKDSLGNKVYYREFDIYPKDNRGPERFVVGSDDSVYYTDTHYHSFIKLK